MQTSWKLWLKIGVLIVPDAEMAGEMAGHLKADHPLWGGYNTTFHMSDKSFNDVVPPSDLGG